MKIQNKNINVPNALTLLRILLIGPFVYFYCARQIVPAVVCLVLSGLSDMFDGKIARRFNQFTELGQMLDPIADKLTQATVAVCLAIDYPILVPLLAIFVIKELAMLAGGAYLVLKAKKRPSGAMWYGKVGTILFYFSFVVIVALRGFWKIKLLPLDIALLTVTAVFMLYALYRYFRIFLTLLHSTDPKDTIDLKADIKARRDPEQMQNAPAAGKEDDS